MEKVTFTIDGVRICARKGVSILEAALKQGIYIPHLCHHPELEPVGACRLCIVEIEGRGLTISCKTPVEEGVVVKTETPEIERLRRVAVELLVVNHHADCLSCVKNRDCKLQEVANYIGIDEERVKSLRLLKRDFPIDDSNPFFDRDPNRCVLCGICVRTCEQVQGVSAIDFAFRGFATVVTTLADKPIAESKCESCGECMVRCPVGALIPKRQQKNAREVKSICPYCGCGCGIYLGVRGTRIVGARGDEKNPVNRGKLCAKGRFGYDFINHPNRLTSPLIKRDGKFVKTSWEEALQIVAQRLSEYKGEQFAMISSAKITNEENYIAQKFTRVVMGTNNIDHCARLCHAPSVAGLAQTFGSGAMTNSINEIGDASCIFAIGTNTTAAHPIIALKIKKAVRNGAKLIVANPKEIGLCAHATVWLRHLPGTDVALLMGMAKVIVDEELMDSSFIQERCEDFDKFKESLKDFDLNFVERITLVPKAEIVEAARLYATCKPSTILYSMGITQHSHGTENVLAISNLALLTGNVGKPSTGVNPLRGQNNVQGACDMGALPNVYPGYQRVDDEKIRRKFEDAWGCTLSASAGLTMCEMTSAAAEGKIKALYIIGENPLLSEADAKHVEEALKNLKFLVVQDIFLSETAKLADVVLPAASFAEKEGTFTNTERRVQLLYKAIEPVGASHSDWQILCKLARSMGAKGFEFEDPSQIMDEIASLTPIYAGISYKRLEDGGLQWPCPDPQHPGTQLLHKEVFATKSGKAKFVPLSYKPPAEVVDEEYPLFLTTDRSLYHFHTGTMTRKVEGLSRLREQEFVEMNPEDARRLQVADGQMVNVISRRGKVEARARVTENCPPGVVSMTFHFAESPTNVLTNPTLDPVAKIPETKVCAVRIEKCAQKMG